MDSDATRAVEVVKETVAVWPAVAATMLIVRAVAAEADTAPTAAMSTLAATVSLLVVILRPGPAAGTAALAARVMPEHVTLTAPAGRFTPLARVIVILCSWPTPPAAMTDVVPLPGGVSIPHRLLACVVT